MSHQRKTRTKSTDPFTDRHTRKLEQLRREIAVEAARIIATESQTNFHTAKKKAAERIGAGPHVALPSNLEVQDALQHYQRLYGGREHAANIEQLRLVAIEAMQQLEEFTPRLVGPVLDGTAGKHARIALHVFSEPLEKLVLFLRERGISFSQDQRQIRWHDNAHRTIPILLVELNGSKVELAVFSPVDLRQSPPSPIDGNPQQRASLADVECLLSPQVLLLENA
jgi:hypothetical protein